MLYSVTLKTPCVCSFSVPTLFHQLKNNQKNPQSPQQILKMCFLRTLRGSCMLDIHVKIRQYIFRWGIKFISHSLTDITYINLFERYFLFHDLFRHKTYLYNVLFSHGKLYWKALSAFTITDRKGVYTQLCIRSKNSEFHLQAEFLSYSPLTLFLPHLFHGL